MSKTAELPPKDSFQFAAPKERDEAKAMAAAQRVI